MDVWMILLNILLGTAIVVLVGLVLFGLDSLFKKIFDVGIDTVILVVLGAVIFLLGTFFLGMVFLEIREAM